MVTQDLSHTGVVSFPEPHVNQVDILNFDGNTVVMAGRRFGKTEVALLKIFRSALDEPGLYWWIGLSWRSAAVKRAWRLMMMYANRIWRAALLSRHVDEKRFISKAQKIVTLPNGSQIWMRTAENPESMVGEGLRGAVMDEFPFMKEEVWERRLRQTLYDHQGWVMMIGVPNGEGWHAKRWRLAAEEPGWKQFHFTSYDNPTIPGLKETLDKERETMSELQWRQEIMAEIVDGAHTVFRGLKNCIDKTLILPGDRKDGHYYIFGVDFAKVADFSVVAVWDMEEHALVHYDRFNIIDYPAQVRRIARMYEIWQPIGVVCDNIGVGAPLISQLREVGLPVIEFHTSSQAKNDAVDKLALDIEYKRVRLPDDKILIDEFQSFSMERTESGIIKYSAPDGYHDDIVMASVMGYVHIASHVMQVF